MTKKERQNFANSVARGLAAITPDWEERIGKFQHFQTCLRTKVVSSKCLCIVSVSVSPPRGTGREGLSLGVGWTDDLDYDYSDPIPYLRPSGVLETMLANPDAPEWKMKRYYTGLEHLKRRGGVFSAISIMHNETPEDLVGATYGELLGYGMPFLREMCFRRGFSETGQSLMYVPKA